MYGKTIIVSDVRELLLNGDFSAWTLDDPDNWTVANEAPPNAEVSQVGSGEGHGGVGTGLCNLYGILGTAIYILQNATTLVIGKKYKVSMFIDTVLNGGFYVYEGLHSQWAAKIINSTGIKTWYFTATHTDMYIRLLKFDGLTDITFDNISIKPVRQILPI